MVSHVSQHEAVTYVGHSESLHTQNSMVMELEAEANSLQLAAT